MPSPRMELIVWMMTFATFGGCETSEKNASGPPGSSRWSMNPQMRRAKPRETCTVEKQNMSTATQKITGVTFRLTRRKRVM